MDYDPADDGRKSYEAAIAAKRARGDTHYLKPPAYAGIGSRDTPEPILNQMYAIAVWLQGEGCTLRSGGAERADTAFERGAGVSKEIYRPSDVSSAALSLAERYHPNWSRCSYPARLLLARNGFQILGRDLCSPSAFVVCWTKDGKASGGTGQALRIAADPKYGVPIFNLHDNTAEERLRAHLTKERA